MVLATIWELEILWSAMLGRMLDPIPSLNLLASEIVAVTKIVQVEDLELLKQTKWLWMTSWQVEEDALTIIVDLQVLN